MKFALENIQAASNKLIKPKNAKDFYSKARLYSISPLAVYGECTGNFGKCPGDYKVCNDDKL